jgi:uncharacterized protein (TIGR03067 family)
MVAMLVATFVGVAAAQDNASKKDLEKIQGVWQLVILEVDGKSQADDYIQKTKMTFKGETSSHPDPEGNVLETKFKLDASKKPAAIDFTPTQGPDAGKLHTGVYQLDGDTLKIVAVRPGKDRPTEMKKEGAFVYVELRRDKK